VGILSRRPGPLAASRRNGWHALTHHAFLSFLARLYQEGKEDDIFGLAAELAFRFFFALFPFFIFLAALGAFVARALDVDNPTNEIMSLFGRSVPPDVESVLRTEIEAVIESESIGLVSIGIAGAMVTAASGVSTWIKGMNRIHKVRETRPFWKRYVVALALTLLAGGTLIAGFLLVVGGQLYGLKLADEFGIEGATATLFALVSWPVVIVAVLTTVAFMYWAAPNTRQPFRWLTPGSVMFTASWLLLNFLFGLYVANLGSYNTTYGALGGVVIVLLWFYLTGFMLFLGAEINAVLRQRQDERLVEAPSL
jgi:membrane protein